MATLLFIDTSSKNCSVLLAEDNQVIAKRFQADTRSHAQLLPLFIEELFEETQLSRQALDAVVVSAGPGSYTGVRIGMSVAKGICYTLDLPLIALDSLLCLAETMQEKQGNNKGIYLATMDSRKGEIYYAAMDGNGIVLEPSQPAVVKDLDWDKWIDKTVYISGNTKEKLKDRSTDLTLMELTIDYSAENYIVKGFQQYMNKTYDNLVYKEPNYLKPFQ